MVRDRSRAQDKDKDKKGSKARSASVPPRVDWAEPVLDEPGPARGRDPVPSSVELLRRIRDETAKKNAAKIAAAESAAASAAALAAAAAAASALPVQTGTPSASTDSDPRLLSPSLMMTMMS